MNPVAEKVVQNLKNFVDPIYEGLLEPATQAIFAKLRAIRQNFLLPLLQISTNWHSRNAFDKKSKLPALCLKLRSEQIIDRPQIDIQG